MAVQEKNTDVVHALIFAGANVDLAENVRTVFSMKDCPASCTFRSVC